MVPVAVEAEEPAANWRRRRDTIELMLCDVGSVFHLNSGNAGWCWSVVSDAIEDDISEYWKARARPMVEERSNVLDTILFITF